MINDIGTNEHYLLHLLSRALEEAVPQEKPSEVSWEEVFRLANRHGVANTACYAVEKLSGKPDAELWKQWKEVKNKAIFKDITFTTVLDGIFTLFAENGIRCLPVKGSRLKELYPRTDMRLMADLDVLIDEENALRVKEILTADGFTCEDFGRTYHDVYRKYPIVELEIHRTLFSKWTKGIHEYYKDGFSHANPVPGKPFVYEMPAEELYAHHVAHLYKHYVKGGTGIRSFMDIHLLRKKFEDSWDEGKVSGILNELGLADFELEMRKLADYWFGNGAASASCLENEKYILESGAYGTMEKRIRNMMQAKTGMQGKVTTGLKLKYYARRLFPGQKYLCSKYPLAKHKLFVPFAWLFWLIKALLFKGKKIIMEVKIVEKQTGSDMKDMHNL